MERMGDQFSFSRTVRWAIPGWVAILTYIAFVILDIMGAGHTQTGLSESVWAILETLQNEKAISPSLLGLLIAAVAGVPLGFLIYQTYFFLKWNSPFSRNGLWPFMRGGLDDIDRMLGEIPLAMLAKNIPWQEEIVSQPIFKIDPGIRWRYIDFRFTEIVNDQEKPDSALYSRYRYLYEMVHLLGVSGLGIYLGFLSYLVHKMSVEPGQYIFYFVFIIGLLYVLTQLLSLEEDSKQKCQESKELLTSGTCYGVTFRRLNIVFEFPASLWLMVLGIILFMVHPSLAPSRDSVFLYLDIVLRFILVVVFAFTVWPELSIKQKAINGSRLSIILACLLGIAIFFYRDSLLGWFDWPFALPTLAFSILNLIFVRNRQNARYDLHGLQNYTFRHFLSGSKNNLGN